MNGRCENDALDAAVDVCDACGGEFCPGCLLFPNGPKRVPLCTACAISAGGVRKAAKRVRLQSRSSASKRRKELRKLVAEHQTQNLVVLDDLPEIDFVEPAEPAPKKKRLRRKGDKTHEPTDDRVADDAEPPEEEHIAPPAGDLYVPLDFEADSAAHDSASKLLYEMRTTGSIEAVTSEGADVWNFPSDFTEPEAEPEQTWTPEPEPQPVFEEFATPSPEVATEPVRQTAPAEEVHTWDTLHDPDASNPFDDPALGRGSVATTGYETNFAAPGATGSPLIENEETSPTQPQQEPPPLARNAQTGERRVNRVPAPQHRSPSAATTAEWHNAAALADFHPEAEPPTDHLLATPAPLVQPAPPEPKRKKMRDLLPRRRPEPAPVVEADVVQDRVQDPTTDTDAAGKWIPPNLRGILSADEQTELPKRQRR